MKILLVNVFAILLWNTPVHAMMSSETDKMAKDLGAETASEVKFDANSTALTADQKKELSDLVAQARQKGEIDEVKVLAWSDKEYPMPKTDQTKGDVDVADHRIKELKTYLKDELHVSDVDGYNMAKRPNKLAEFLKTPGAKIKNKAETVGAAPRNSDETGFLGLKGQKSKAVIMVFLKK